MGSKRQKNQLLLAFMTQSRSEAPKAVGEGAELPMVKREPESLASTEQLLEEVCQRKNLESALKRVTANQGSPGVDGMTVRKLPGYLRGPGLVDPTALA